MLLQGVTSKQRYFNAGLSSTTLARHSVKRSDVTGNRFEWKFGENKVT